MKTHYKRINAQERIQIEKLLSHGYSYNHIARELNRSKSTIQREVKRHATAKSKYSGYHANIKATVNSSCRKYGKSKILLNPSLLFIVHQKLNMFWAPTQICAHLRKHFNDPRMNLSHESIYLYIYLHAKKELKDNLIKHLRQKRKQRGNTRRGIDKRTTIVDPIRIDERPDEVIGREIPGHWEGDLIMGKNRESAIGTLVERTTRALILVKIKSKNATDVRKAFEKEFKVLPKQLKKSLTYDNGSEMAQHKLFTQNTKVQVYFTHPYSPWERPTNENTNGLLRDYFPKGTDLSIFSRKRLKEIQDELNERPRKVLNWDTPKDVFHKLIIEKM